MSLPDISDYFDKDDNGLVEHLQWIVANSGKFQLDFVRPHFEEAQLRSVVEFGCGSGLLAYAWVEAFPELRYDGIDKSESMLGLATDPEIHGVPPPGLIFTLGDVRDSSVMPTADCTVAFALMKHFALEEWDDILGKILANGRYGAFDVQLAEHDHDNGRDYHHTYVSESRFLRALRMCGHEILDRVTWQESDVEGLGHMRTVVFWTKKRST